jgi:hypothetical protein
MGDSLFNAHPAIFFSLLILLVFELVQITRFANKVAQCTKNQPVAEEALLSDEYSAAIPVGRGSQHSEQSKIA